MSQIIAPVEYTVTSDEQVSFAGLQSGTCNNREDPITLDELEEDPDKLGFVFSNSDSRGNKLFDCYQEPEPDSTENLQKLIIAGRNPMTRKEFDNGIETIAYLWDLRDPRLRAEKLQRDKEKRVRREEEMRDRYDTTVTLVVDGVENNFTIDQYCNFLFDADDYRFYDLQSQAVELIIGERVKKVDFAGILFASFWSMLRRVVFPDSVESISFGEFNNAVLLETISFPRGLKTLETGAFSDCTRLKSIYFNSNVDVIGSFAFKKCIALETVVFNGAVSLIKNDAFKDCTSLRAVTVSERTTIEEGAFDPDVVITRRQVRELDENDGPPRQRMAIGALLNWMNSNAHLKKK